MKSAPVAALLLLAALCQSCPLLDNEVNQLWHRYKMTHHKSYTGNIEQVRKNIFKANLRQIIAHNLKYEMGMSSYRMGINQFADMTAKEVTGTLDGLVKPVNRTGFLFEPTPGMELPASVDWRTKGYVTEVKDQGHCNSGWAFSSTGALEGQHYRKTGNLVSLSEQNLVDCTVPLGNGGCKYGASLMAYDYVVENKGLDTEESYPYEAKDGNCRYKKDSVGATCVGYYEIKYKSEKDLQQAVATVGPIAAGMDARHESFRMYRGGIYDEPKCNENYMNHGVLVVGYGTENGQDYWLAKNSWGTSWGEKGYIKMPRNKNNQCGIASLAVYPIV